MFTFPTSLKTTSIGIFMAKNKSVKLETKSPKRKKSGLNESPVSGEDIAETKAKKKKEAPEEISSVTEPEDYKNLEKDKKRQKKERDKGQTQTKQTEEPPEDKLEEDLSPEEKRVLERKIKKILKKEEKKRLKAEGHSDRKTAAGPSASQQALEYLTCWAENRSMWKFQKTRQTWLLQHMFDSEKIPDEKFPLLLQYLEGLRGMARDTTVEKAMSMVEESGGAPEDAVIQQSAHRAKEIIQMLS